MLFGLVNQAESDALWTSRLEDALAQQESRLMKAMDQKIADAERMRAQRIAEIMTLIGVDISEVSSKFAAYVADLEATVGQRQDNVAELWAKYEIACDQLASAEDALDATTEAGAYLPPADVDIARYKA